MSRLRNNKSVKFGGKYKIGFHFNSKTMQGVTMLATEFMRVSFSDYIALKEMMCHQHFY